MYIADPRALDAAIEALMGAPAVAIDTEFMRERTYFARLCLVQMATVEAVYVIDAVALGDKIAPLAALLSDERTVKVLHAASQDVEVLLRATGSTPSPIFDTQVAATLAGSPTQIGYANLVKEMLGVEIDKADTFTDWSVRPLSSAQLAYAEADVVHLIRIYTMLKERLEAEGRLAWLAEDFARLSDPETYRVDPRIQYLRVKRASSLDRRGLAVLREVAAWRENEAQRRDIPRRWLVADESLIEIARRRPKDTAGLAAIRGVNDRVAGRDSAGLVAAIIAGEAVSEEDLPRLPKRTRIPRDVHPIADVLQAVCRVRAREHGVAATMFATRDELERFAAGERDGHPLASGWRRTLVGEELAAICDGRRSVTVEEGKLVVRDLDVRTHAEKRSDADA
ncbi:MAG: ribonuclease D [Coriobacteriia bacterium]|nr:ribonuclease D [Coriobacteriia bacterium]